MENGGAMTELDLAQEAGAGEEQRLGFFRLLADTPLLVLLADEAQGDTLVPRIFELEKGRFVLAFDREERLAAFCAEGGPQPYGELPGRVLARLLAAEGLGLGLNLGSASASQMLLDPAAMDWLAQMLSPAQVRPMADLSDFGPPSQDLVRAMERVLGSAPPSWGGMAGSVRLYRNGARGLVLVEGAAPAAQAPLASAISEALRFAGVEDADIGFAGASAAPLGGERLDWPAPAPVPVPVPQATPAAPKAPGTDPDRPPKLR